jgi:hypothetical protein
MVKTTKQYKAALRKDSGADTAVFVNQRRVFERTNFRRQALKNVTDIEDLEAYDANNYEESELLNELADDYRRNQRRVERTAKKVKAKRERKVIREVVTAKTGLDNRDLTQKGIVSIISDYLQPS